MGNFSVFEVGKRVPYPFDGYTGGDGAIMSMTADGKAAIAIYLRGMTKEEEETLREPIKTAYVSEPASVLWLGMLKIGHFLMEIEYNPMLFVQAGGTFSADFFKENQAVHIMCVDSDGMILKIIRLATFPLKFLESLRKAYEKFDPSEVYAYTHRFQAYLAKWRSYPQKNLWRMMNQSGSFGDEK